MLGRTDNRNKILRIMCMFMLMLIHLDAYLYETIHVFQNDVTSVRIEQSSEDTLLQEQAPYQAEWGDLSYAHTSPRFSLANLSVYLLPLLCVFKSVFFKVKQRFYRLFSEYLYSGTPRPYVVYGSLLI